MNIRKQSLTKFILLISVICNLGYFYLFHQQSELMQILIINITACTICSIYCMYRNFLSSFIVICSLGLCLPIMGIVSYGLIKLCLKFRKNQAIHKFEQTTYAISPIINFRNCYGAGGLINHIKNTRLSLESRIEALIELYQLSHSNHNYLLKNLLTSESDELKVTTIKIIEQKTKKINNIIDSFYNQTNYSKLSNIQRCVLAHALWEMVYQSLISCEYQKEYLENALKILTQDSHSLYVHDKILLGKIALKLGNLKEALNYFNETAIDHTSSSKVIPYLAEIYYQLRNYNQLKRLLGDNDISYTNEPALAKLLWTHG